VSAALLLWAVSAVAAGMLLSLDIDGQSLLVEVAATPETRRLGLMHRDALAEDRGMLFVYEKSRKVAFWMKDTKIALDIAFINKSGEIMQIEYMQPFDEMHTRSREAIRYTLEVNLGWFAKHNVRVGARVKGLPK